jgi:hypothetical protein
MTKSNNTFVILKKVELTFAVGLATRYPASRTNKKGDLLIHKITLDIIDKFFKPG